MATVTTTNLDPRTVAIGPVRGIEALIAFGAEDTFAKGTVLGRKVTSADSYAGVITGTGTRVVTLTARPGKSLKVGAYTLTVGDVTAGAGPATLVDPDGVSASVTLAASGDHEVPSLGVNFNIAASGTALGDNDVVAFTVAAATGKPIYAPYSPTGVNGAQNPNGVLADELYRASAGNEPARPIIAGDVNLALLVVDGVGALTSLSAIDQLRVNGIWPEATTELGKYDNPAPTP